MKSKKIPTLLMFLFRCIIGDDIQFKLITGNEAFDELAPNGSLEHYLEQDSIKGGDYLTYLLLEEQKSNYHLLGLLRYRNTTKKEFLEQLANTSVSDNIRKNIKSLFSLNKFDIIYLSRIGVSKAYQEMRISQIISNFFEFLIQRKRQSLLVYSKILEDLTNVIGSKYRVLGRGTDKKWGNFFLVSKIIEYNPENK